MARRFNLQIWRTSWTKDDVTMILYTKIKKAFGKEYDSLPNREKISIKCDYCGLEFSKSKGNTIKGRKIIPKDSCSKCVKLKREEASLKLYGVKNAGGTKESLQKAKNTFQKKYGVKNAMEIKEIKEKIAKTNIEKYGVDCVFKSKKIKEKIKNTNFKKYGEEIASKAKVIKEKTKRSNQKKYKEGHFSKTQKYIDQVKETNFKKYGFENAMYSPEILEKRKKYFFDKYGVEFPLNSPEIQEKIKNIFLNKYGHPYPKNKKYGKTQNKIKLWLDSLGLDFQSNYSILGGQEIDLFNENLKIGIEYCGLFWHNEESKSPRLKNYHYDKFKKCSKQNIFLITIFEDEWRLRQKQCKNFLKSIFGKSDKKVFARNCAVQEIKKITYKNFCDQNHIQGQSALSLIHYGLFYKEELISVISLGRHHRGKNGKNDIVLDRFCVKDDYSVAGGFSKLFKKCREWAKNNKYKRIISWSDNRWSRGNVYLKNGFKLECELPMDYSYVNIKNPKIRISKQSQSKKRTNCPEDKTEKEWCLERGLARIWDCGKKRWVYDL